MGEVGETHQITKVWMNFHMEVRASIPYQTNFNNWCGCRVQLMFEEGKLDCFSFLELGN